MQCEELFSDGMGKFNVTIFIMTIFKTKRMEVREFSINDLEDLCRLHFDKEVMRYLVGGIRADKNAVEKDLNVYLKHQREHGFSKWAIVDSSTSELMGRAGYIAITETGEIDLG